MNDSILDKLRESQKILTAADKEMAETGELLAKVAELQEKSTLELRKINATILEMTAEMENASAKIKDILGRMDASAEKDREQRILNELQFQESITPLVKN